jgi:hypothetical protein
MEQKATVIPTGIPPVMAILLPTIDTSYRNARRIVGSLALDELFTVQMLVDPLHLDFFLMLHICVDQTYSRDARCSISKVLIRTE